jgi:hypothetical protein
MVPGSEGFLNNSAAPPIANEGRSTTCSLLSRLISAKVP